MGEQILNLKAWIHRRRRNIGPYADVIIHEVGKYEDEIRRLRDNEKFLRDCLADRGMSATKHLPN